MPKCLALDADGDLLFQNGKLSLTETLEQFVRQRVKERLSFWYGSWYLNLLAGLPIMPIISSANPDIPLLSNIIQRVIEGTPGVQSVTSLTIDRDRKARTMVVNFTATGAGGAVVSSATELVF